MGPAGRLDTLGSRLKFVRENVLGWSTRRAQQELSANGVDIESHSTVLRYEKDQRVPGADYVAVLARMAGVSADWLLTGEGSRQRPATNGRDPYTEGVNFVTGRVIKALLEAQATIGQSVDASGLGRLAEDVELLGGERPPEEADEHPPEEGPTHEATGT